MARVTARRVFARVRNKKERDRKSASQVLNAARSTYLNDLKRIGLATTSSTQDKTASIMQENFSNPTHLPTRTPAKTKKIPLKKHVVNNRKITDYYSSVRRDCPTVNNDGCPPTVKSITPKVTVDDVEIIDVLPPIPLRQHPVVDLDTTE